MPLSSKRPGRFGLSPADEFPAFFDAVEAVLDECFGGCTLGVGVADDFVADGSAEEFVDGHVDGFAFDVPKGDVDGADGASVDAVCGEEVSSEHELPEAFGFPWVGTDDDLCEVVDGFHDCASHAGDSNFAEAVDSGIGFDTYEEGDSTVIVSDGYVLYCGDLHWMFLFLLRRRKGLSPVVMLKMVLPCSHVLRVDGFFALARCHSERSEESDHLAVGCHLRFFTPLRFVQNDMFGGCAPFRMTWLRAALSGSRTRSNVSC